MHCRPAKESDIAWLAETSLAAYRDTFVPMLPDCAWQARDRPYFLARFGREWPQARLIEAEGTPLGFHRMTGRHIDLFFVAGAARGRGIGAALLADAVEMGARTLECFALNTGARRFYERLGWRREAAYAREFLGRPCDFVSYRRSD